MKDLGEEYTNIFYAQVDAAYSALEKVDAFNVEILVTETGWPSCEGTAIAIKLINFALITILFFLIKIKYFNFKMF